MSNYRDCVIKFLEVEGDIKNGDSYIQKGDIGRKIWHNFRYSGMVLDMNDYQLVKPFLCLENYDTNDCSFHYLDGKFIKEPYPYDEDGGEPTGRVGGVLGIISPDATWIKDGDKYNEYNAFPRHTHGPEPEEAIIYLDDNDEPTDIPMYNLKGPCGHFH
jgi:hypothetical protein